MTKRIYFVPRQAWDPHCNVIGMYYTHDFTLVMLTDIELTLQGGDDVLLVPAPENFIAELRTLATKEVEEEQAAEANVLAPFFDNDPQEA